MADAEKLLPKDKLYEGYPKINKAIDNANSAARNASTALEQASNSLMKSNATQQQLDNIILENGQNDAEIVQSRGDFPLLYQRLDANDDNLAKIIGVTGVSLEAVERIIGESDDSGRAQRAIDSLDENGVLVLPYGKTYYINNVSSSGKSINIIGIGATVIQSGNNTVFSFSGGWEFITPVSTLTNVDYDFSNGNSTTTPVTRVTLSSVPETLKVGDVVKVISDDEIANAYQGGGTSTTKKRRGEFATVYYILGNDVYLSGRLRDTYTTNIRFAKLKDVNYSMSGITFDVDPTGYALGWNRVLVKFSAARNVKIDIRCLNSYDSFVLMMGIYNYKAQIDANNCLNEPTKNRYGYGINDSSCGNGVIYNSSFVNCRHGFTTSTGYIPAGSSAVENYGRSESITIIDSFGVGCSNSPFDVHEEAYNLIFDNCHADGNVAGSSGSGYGFQARAKKIKFINCTAKNTRGGFYVFEQYAGTTEDVQIIECSTSNVETSLNIKGNSGTGLRVRDVRVSGGRFESYGAMGNYIENADVSFVNNVVFQTKGYQGMVLGNNAFVKQRNTRFIVLSVSSSYRVIDITGSGTTLDLRNIDIDVSSVPVADGKLIRLSNASSSIVGEGVNIITAGKAITNVFDSLGSGTGTLKVTKITADQDVLILSDVNFETIVYSYVTPTRSTAARFQDLSADNAVPAFRGINDDLFIRIKPLSSNKVLGVFPLGVRLGQRLIIRNSGTSYSTTIKHGTAYNTNIGSDTVMAPDAVMSLFWDGTYWTKTAA